MPILVSTGFFPADLVVSAMSNIVSYSSGSGIRPGFPPGVAGSSRSSSLERSTKPRGYFEQLAGLGLGVGNLLAENVLSHPCVVLRRQCQVNCQMQNAHLTPFSLLPVVVNLQQNQTLGTLWKGVSSTIVVHGLEAGIETVLADFTGLPRSVNRYSSQNKVVGHLLLKTISFGLTSTFYAASLVETVQSDCTSDRSGVFDCIREGFNRIKADFVGPRDSRRIPTYIIIGPAVLYRLIHYVLSGLSHTLIQSAVKRKLMSKPVAKRTIFDDFFPDLCATFTSHLLADALLFPAETVIHRLYLQGTRTIVDNLDTGDTVLPVSTRYEGIFDCIRSIRRDEGISGFYKGFGALVLQYSLHLALLRVLCVLFEYLEMSFKPERNVPVPPEVEQFRTHSAGRGRSRDEQLNLLGSDF